MIHPEVLRENGFTVNKCLQNPGEFVVTKCGAYHAGFNMGYNCAEAVNFALKNWVKFGRKAGYCKCHKDSVKIDMDFYEENVKKSEANIELNIECIEKGGDKLIGKKTKRARSSKENNSSGKRTMLGKQAKISKNKIEKKTKENDHIDNWLCCDFCNKWRKIQQGKIIMP